MYVRPRLSVEKCWFLLCKMETAFKEGPLSPNSTDHVSFCFLLHSAAPASWQVPISHCGTEPSGCHTQALVASSSLEGGHMCMVADPNHASTGNINYMGEYACVLGGLFVPKLIDIMGLCCLILPGVSFSVEPSIEGCLTTRIHNAIMLGRARSARCHTSPARIHGCGSAKVRALASPLACLCHVGAACLLHLTSAVRFPFPRPPWRVCIRHAVNCAVERHSEADASPGKLNAHKHFLSGFLGELPSTFYRPTRGNTNRVQEKAFICTFRTSYAKGVDGQLQIAAVQRSSATLPLPEDRVPRQASFELTPLG